MAFVIHSGNLMPWDHFAAFWAAHFFFVCQELILIIFKVFHESTISDGTLEVKLDEPRKTWHDLNHGTFGH
jgi:hypothetical protein